LIELAKSQNLLVFTVAGKVVYIRTTYLKNSE